MRAHIHAHAQARIIIILRREVVGITPRKQRQQHANARRLLLISGGPQRRAGTTWGRRQVQVRGRVPRGETPSLEQRQQRIRVDGNSTSFERFFGTIRVIYTNNNHNKGDEESPRRSYGGGFATRAFRFLQSRGHREAIHLGERDAQRRRGDARVLKPGRSGRGGGVWEVRGFIIRNKK